MATDAEAVTRRDDVVDSVYTSAGASNAFDAVAMLDRSGDLTSAVLVNSLWVLTAAHVVDPNANGIVNYVSDAFTVNFTGGLQLQSAEIILNPAWIAEGSASTNNGNDLALIRLSAPVTTITPVQIYDGTSEVGLTGDFVGYGVGGTGSAGGSGSRGTKRAGTNLIDASAYTYLPGQPGEVVMNHGRLLFYDFDDGTSPENELGLATQTVRESMVSLGDSGGALMTNIGGQDQLVGIHVEVFPDGDGINFNYGDVGASTRVSAHRDWILSVIPEPSSTMLLMLGLLALGWMRQQ